MATININDNTVPEITNEFPLDVGSSVEDADGSVVSIITVGINDFPFPVFGSDDIGCGDIVGMGEIDGGGLGAFETVGIAVTAPALRIYREWYHSDAPSLF
jgi:hypothetical protein